MVGMRRGKVRRRRSSGGTDGTDQNFSCSRAQARGEYAPSGLFLAVVTGGILGIGVLFNVITHWFI
jgi:hypothetical protein